MSKSAPKIKHESCVMCGLYENNEAMFGKMYTKGTITAHANCLLFSSGLEQRSKKPKDGILRFLLVDILREAVRGKRLRCHYCKKIGATVGCVLRKCCRSFHFPCGLNYRVVNQYFGNFSSFCDLHKPAQKDVEIKTDLYCYICCTTLDPGNLNDCLYSPCCKNNWFHRHCLQQYASSAGKHFFKCPLCNNTTEFVKEMQQLGICIPIKDADWELEENAFQELLFRPECDPNVCECLKVSNHDGKGAWRLIACEFCGGRATHQYCGGLKGKQSWLCKECEALQVLIKKRREEEAIENERKKQILISEIMSNKMVPRIILKKMNINNLNIVDL